MTRPTTTNQNGRPTLSKIPELADYTQEELKKNMLPGGSPYLPLLGKDPLYTLRHEAWLRCALATVLNRAHPRDVCWFWSEAADKIITQVFKQTCDSEELAIFALGKLGSKELNLSSDIDLLVISKNGRPEDLKQVREFHQIISQVTLLGFLFRCDFDLRPGGKSASIVPTVDQVIDYYGNYGETWERIAYVRCRFVCGSSAVKNEIEPFLQRFIFRRHLDYELFDDLKGLREKIQKAVNDQDDAIHLKLAPGGIRDIELFINSLQVIHGGRNTKLQVTNTGEAFDLIEAEKNLPTEEIEFFRGLYWRLRQLENFVQAQNDSQTHSISKSKSYPPFILESMKNLETDLEESSSIVSSLLGNIDEVAVTAPFDEKFQAILDLPLLSRNKEKDHKTRSLVLKKFSEALYGSSGDADMALGFLKEFVTSVRAKSGLFSLLAREEKLVEDLSWLFGHSPYLSQILCQRPELLDSFVFRSQELQHNDVEVLLEQLLEKRMLGEIIEGSNFLKTRQIERLNDHLSQLADDIALEILWILEADSLEVLCLGKWGGRELGFQSDLDFILVTQEEPGESHYKWGRRLISRLTEPHRGGSLYSIDMRLKPSGLAGPLITKVSALIEYLEEDAEAWERQAYLRARGLRADSESIRQACYKKELTNSDLKELNRIRQQLVKSSDLDLKYSLGGMLDIELFAQTYLLLHQLPSGPSTHEMLEKVPESARLQKNYRQLRLTEQLLHLISFEGESDLQRKTAYIRSLAALFNKSEESLLQEIKSLLQENVELLNELDPRRRSE